MLSQKLENIMSEKLTPNEINSKTYKGNEDFIRNVSTCTCSQCDLVSCFDIRNQISYTSCTCSLCKYPESCGNSKKRVTDKKLDSNNVNDTNMKHEIEQIEKELCSEITKVANAELDNRQYTKFSSKDISLKKDKMERIMNSKSYEKSSTRQLIHSVAINYLPKERNDSTAKLSAQIMNMPYQDFKDSLSIENSHKKSSTFNIKGIVKPDLLTRLKEIYDACSCKVCECITGKSLSLNNDTCNCKPCDCDECTNRITNIKKVSHDGCPCVSCDKKDCRGVVKSNQGENSCICVPCDCVKCSENFVTSCDCEPCQCVECKALGVSLMRTLTVAPVHSNMQQNMCQCEPCECENCTHNYSAMSSLRRQVSREIISNTNCHCDGCLNDACQLNSEVCRCDMQSKVMKKPIEGANRDYDIHRTLIDRQKETSKFNTHDTIVTFALYNNHSNTISYSKSNCNDCQCLKCDCYVCKGKKEYKEADNRKLHNKMLNKYSKSSFDSLNTCKCAPCECQICKSSKSDKQRYTTEARRFKIICGCNKCACVVCNGSLDSKNQKIDNKSKTDSLVREATKNTSCESSQVLKKGIFITPSTFEANMRLESQQQSCLSNENIKRETTKMPYLNVSSDKSSCRKISHHQVVTACHTQSKHNNINSVYEKINKFQNFQRREPENILLDDCQNAGLKNMIEDTNTLKKSITFIKNCADNNTDTKLCEMLNAIKQNPIRDIELLNKCINLTKSSSNLYSNEYVNYSENVFKDESSNSNIETGMFHREPVPCILQMTPKESMHTILSSTVDSENINFDKEHNFETLHTASSKCIILRDRKSPLIVIDNNEFEKIDSINITKSNTIFKSKFKIITDTNPADPLLISSNDKNVNDGSHEIMDLKSDTLNKDLKVEEEVINAKNDTKLTEHKTYKSSKKCKGKKYLKMYSRLNKTKRRNDKVKVNGKSYKIIEQAKLETKEYIIRNSFSDVFGKDIYPTLNNKVTESLEYPVRNARDLDELTKNLLSTSVDKILIETQTQNTDSGDNNDAWPIMRKNLYLNCPHVAKSKGICTIPAMEFDIRTSFKSISMQTSECAYKIGKSNGKHALTRLLIEVNNLLNSPLLQSSHTNKKYSDIIQESNNLTKSKFDLELKVTRSDGTSQTHSNCGPVDKETCCNLIQSMEALQRNIKHLMDNIMTNAVYKSELLTTKLNLVQGCTQNIPKINSCKSSCHGLKATFTGLRTISDHTIMVKWRLPREVVFVQGYELQVDGRSVQKIFSPTRCMAILTCLPHSEKLLLTIRTLTTSTLLSDHQPATTIVYRPRMKCI